MYGIEFAARYALRTGRTEGHMIAKALEREERRLNEYDGATVYKWRTVVGMASEYPLEDARWLKYGPRVLRRLIAEAEAEADE